MTEKFEVAPIALALNEAFLAISLAYGIVAPILSAFRISQKLIQAVAPGSSPLLQLPYITTSIAQALEGEDSKGHLSVQDFMRIPEERRRKLAVASGLLSDTQYRAAVAVAKQLPVFRVEKAFFKVTGEKFITPGSLVQFVVKARIIPPGTVNVPAVNELDLEDIDPAEDDLDAILGRKPQKNKKAKSADGKGTEAASEEKSIQPPLAFAPYFARDHSPRWHVFLSDSKMGRTAVQPFVFTTFDKPLFDEQGNATFNMQTLKMQFGAPPQAGQFTFVMHLICDSYVGIDTKMEVTMNVEEMAKAVEMQDEDEISEPEEGTSHVSSLYLTDAHADACAPTDSIAGQMSALKTGGNSGPPPKRKVRKPVQEESSDDESDTEGDEEDASETDTDTDTDEE